MGPRLLHPRTQRSRICSRPDFTSGLRLQDWISGSDLPKGQERTNEASRNASQVQRNITAASLGGTVALVFDTSPGKRTEETKPRPILERRTFQATHFLELVGKQCCKPLRRVQRYLVRGQRPAHWICASRQLARVWHITAHWRKNSRQNRETCQDHYSLQYRDWDSLAW